MFLLALLITPAAVHEVTTPFLKGDLASTPLIVTAPIQQPTPLLIPPSPSGAYVAIVVENGLWGTPAVQIAVTQYRTDLNNTGYNTILYTSTIPNAPTLRGLLQTWYTSNNIIGAVLIGNLPYIRFEHGLNTSGVSGGYDSFPASTPFICDLYYMDLDGSWYDTDTNSVYDRHNASAGYDIFPEIYVGRLDASTRTYGGQTNANDIIMLLNRIHSYRTGSVARTHRALTYIDDDWQAWANGTYDVWPAWFNNAYSNHTDIHTPGTWTNATDWLSYRLNQDYEWVHLCAHSTPTYHAFGKTGGPSEGTVTAAQIHSQVPTFNFYNLFSCSGSNWLSTDCLATTYLFSGSHSLAVIGSTKTGGMLGGNHFYDPIGQNETIGQALKNWFTGIKSYTYYYLEWFYGMCILGDPFLTTHYDITALAPTITSSTHPDPTAWSTNILPQFNWTIPADVNGIAGYYYILDQNPTTIPTASTGTYTTVNGTAISTPLSDSTWFFHVVTKDTVGNIGSEAAHYQINIDSTNPIVIINSPIDGATVLSEFIISWSVTENGSGYSSANIYVNGSIRTTVNAPQMNTTITNLALGTYSINVTVFDLSGFQGSQQITVTVITPPVIPGFPVGAIILGVTFAISFGIIKRGRKR